MSLTNFPHGLLSSGVPVSGGYIPPIIGTYYHVCPGISTIVNAQGKQVIGSSSNDGLSPLTPLDSIVTAYGKCTSGAGDGIIVWSYGTTTAACTSYLSSSLTWSKHGITTVGVSSGAMYNNRARISQLSTATMYSLLDVTGNNNLFMNLSFVNGSDLSDAQITAVKLSGGSARNSFVNCDFKGTPASASAYKCDLWLSNTHENTIAHCNFGNASYNAGNNAAAFIYLDGSSGNAQNTFENCTAYAQVSTGTAFGGLKSGSATSLNGANIFRDCDFVVWQANTGQPSMASWFIGTKPNTGTIVVRECSISGFDAYDATAGNDFIAVVGPADNAGAGVTALP